MSTFAAGSIVGPSDLCADQACAVVVIFYAPTDAPSTDSTQHAGAPPESLLSARALQRLVLRHGLVIAESGAGGAPYYQRVLRCVAETLVEAEALLYTLNTVGNLLRTSSYFEGVRCHPLFPVLLTAQHCAAEDICPVIHASILDYCAPEDFLHEAPLMGADPAWCEQAVRELRKILQA